MLVGYRRAVVDDPHPSAGEIQGAIELVPAPVIVSEGESHKIVAMNQSAADEFRLDPADASTSTRRSGQQTKQCW